MTLRKSKEMSTCKNDGTYFGDISLVRALQFPTSSPSPARSETGMKSDQDDTRMGHLSTGEGNIHNEAPSYSIYYSADRHSQISYLQNYFMSAQPMFWIFPQSLFLSWVQHYPNKSQLDIALVRAMQAVGSLVSPTQESKVHASELSQITQSAVMQEKDDSMDMRLVQIRIMIAQYHFRTGDQRKAAQFASLALRSARMQELYLETSEVPDINKHVAMFGFDQAVLQECRRRTFWAAFMLNCFESTEELRIFVSGQIRCHLHLPCNEKFYERGIVPQTPIFRISEYLEETLNSEQRTNIGLMAYWVLMASLWDDINSSAQHQQPLPQMQDVIEFHQRHQKITRHLRAWKEAYQIFTTESISLAQSGRQSHPTDIITSLHFLYESAMMRLNRHVLASYLQDWQMTHLIRTVHSHAFDTLKMARRLYEQRVQMLDGTIGFISTNPSTGFAIMAAIDVITSTGLFETLLNVQSQQISLVAGGIAVLEELAKYWPIADTLRKLVAHRYQILLGMGLASTQGKKAYWVRSPIDRSFGLEKDLMYIMPRKTVMLALGYDVESCDDHTFVEIDDNA